jgi:hypothetical protein
MTQRTTTGVDASHADPLAVASGDGPAAHGRPRPNFEAVIGGVGPADKPTLR